jgi:hypothetical protein
MVMKSAALAQHTQSRSGLAQLASGTRATGSGQAPRKGLRARGRQIPALRPELRCAVGTGMLVDTFMANSTLQVGTRRGVGQRSTLRHPPGRPGAIPLCELLA